MEVDELIDELIEREGGYVNHPAAIAVGPRHRLGDPEPRRPALVGGMVHITALALDHRIDQRVDVHNNILHRILPAESQSE